MRSMVLPAALLAAAGAAAQQPRAGRAFQPNDWHRLKTVSSPALSPDGRMVAFTVQTIRESENKYHREVWVARTSCAAGTPAAACEPVRYTAPGYESSNPRWSPDGKYLLFSSNRPGGKPGNGTWVLRMDQPGGEAFQDETIALTGSSPADGRFVVWSDTMEADSAMKRDTSAARDLFAKMGATARPPYGAITRPVDPARFDGRQITDMRYKVNGPGYLPNRRGPRRYTASQLWIGTFDGKPKRMLTNTPYSHGDVAVSPDGKWIAFTADARLRPDSVVEAERDSLSRLPYDEKRELSQRGDEDIFVVSADGGAPRRVTRLESQQGGLAWSPDGKWISFVAAPSRVKSQRIYVVPADGSGAPDNVLGSWQYEPAGYVWTPAGDILFSADVGGRTAVLSVSPRTKGAPVELVGGRRRLAGVSFDARKTTMAYVATSMTKPTELYLSDATGKNERQLTHLNDTINAEVAWSDADRFTYKSVGGMEIEGWLMKPYGYQPGKKYPLVLYIHGGPHSAYGEGWFDEFQNLAAAGMWVLFTNPRGSSGYGADFTYASRFGWGGDDYTDLMKAVDIAAARPDVDSTRMGVTGGSYGGFMTAWVTTKTNRFKAAEADRMISEWTFWYGASDAQGLTEFEFAGKPWENQAMYDTLSPIRFVKRVKTPTLIVQSEEDFRTPIGNAELWFMALKKQGVPVEFVRYPRSTHDLSRTGEPWLLVDRLGRLRQWFGYWLLDQKPGTMSVSER